jgi:predicted O-methyltransferase YrrM
MLLIYLFIFLVILVYFINVDENYENTNESENKKKLQSLIENSDSNEIVKNISENMYGSTMHHHYHILYDIRTLLGPNKKIYTEIGSFNGGSLSLMLSHNYETEMNCIDPLHLERTSRTIIEKNIDKYNKNNYKVNIFQNFSTDNLLLKKLRETNFKTDILFIDGDHSYDVVMKDYNNFVNFVNPGGWIIFDDYEDYEHSPDVKIAVNDIIKSIDLNKFEVIGNLDNIKNAKDIYSLKKSNEFILVKKY